MSIAAALLTLIFATLGLVILVSISLGGFWAYKRGTGARRPGDHLRDPLPDSGSAAVHVMQEQA